MGIYIDPTNETKEKWLDDHGVIQDGGWAWDMKHEDELPVVVIDNGPFVAAGVCYSEREFNAFMSPDGRLKIIVTVPIDDLMAVTNGNLGSYLK